MKFNEYDVIIIGAGIGGLVCGCYLAKAGKKVLIIEKNESPGGCCASFEAKGFCFDAFVHSLGSLRAGGRLYEILNDLDLLGKISFLRFSPSDIVHTPNSKVSFYGSPIQTRDEFVRIYPKEEKMIKKFFENIESSNLPQTAYSLRKITFGDLMNRYFYDQELKDVFALVVWGNAGVPPDQINSFTALQLIREFMLDGGYYPEGGIRRFPEVLAQRFKELGGKIIYSEPVQKVFLKNNRILYLKSKKESIFRAKNYVANCDIKKFVSGLMEGNDLDDKLFVKIMNYKLSVSLFILYLGLGSSEKLSIAGGATNWILRDLRYDMLEFGSSAEDYTKNLLLRYDEKGKTIQIYCFAPQAQRDIAIKEKNIVKELLLNSAEKLIPGVKNKIVFEKIATPLDIERWTSNSQGAAYGWALNISQFLSPLFYKNKIMKNLYICSHWSTLAQGVPGVAFVGKYVSNAILSFRKRG